jgi:DNA-binding transcriptional LysR family regulator
MPVLDSEQLNTLIAVIDAGSLTAAAPRVFLSQSAVSEQMRKLEARVGVALFTRSKSGVAATAAGERLAVYARQIVALSDRAMRDLHDDALAGELRLGVTDYFRPGDLATLLSRLNGAYPQLRLHVTVLKSGAIEAGYAAGDFDVGLTMRILHARAAPERPSPCGANA